jgi:thiol:disulfide interchange protein
VLSSFPGLLHFLPRPGAWMETFKQGMAFLLYATVVYLVWVMTGQVGDERLYGSQGLLFALLALVGVALAAWIYGRWTPLHRPFKTRRVGFILSASVLAGALYAGYPQADAEALKRLSETASGPSDGSFRAIPAVTPGSDSVYWDIWEPGKAEALAQAGHTVYVDFTARWCVTCQTNKGVVFGSNEVLEIFRQEKIVALKADWTNRDPRITQALRSFGKAAVPFNVIYAPGRAPAELPAVLTPGIVLDAIASGNADTAGL